jgi:tetratricopeptide (TPR) repeat protein
LAAYTPAIPGRFIWDDDDYVENNAMLRDFSGLRDIWLRPRSSPQYYPLVHTTYWLEYQLSGLAPHTFHLTNIGLHMANAILLWVVLRKLAVPGAWFVALVFAVHPVHVESVAWITERKNVLSGFFYFLAALCFLQYTSDFDASRPRRPWFYVLALLSFLAALLSKTVTATLPAAILLVSWWKRGRIDRHDAIAVAPMFLIAIPMGLYTAWLEKHHVGAVGAEWSLSLLERSLIAGRACWFYAGKLAYPWKLTFIYPRWQVSTSDPAWLLYLIAALALVGGLWTYRARIGRGPLVGVLFFGGSLFPALGFFNVLPHRYSFVADHFQYLASVGMLSLFVAAWLSAAARYRLERWSAPLAATVVVVLSVMTWSQCWIYADREALWTDTIRKNPHAEIAYTNLGMYYIEQERYAEALDAFQHSSRLSPRDAVTRNNLGVVYGHLEMPGAAIEHLRAAIQTDPSYSDAYNNLGALLCDQGETEEAIAHLRTAIRLRSDAAAYHYNLGRALHLAGHQAEAQQSFETAERLSPGN